MATKKKRDQINIDFTNYPELLKAVEQMAEDDDMKLGPFLRKLVKQEKARRDQAQLPSPAKNPARRKTDSRTAQAIAA